MALSYAFAAYLSNIILQVILSPTSSFCFQNFLFIQDFAFIYSLGLFNSFITSQANTMFFVYLIVGTIHT
jgi:hypothetical protein